MANETQSCNDVNEFNEHTLTFYINGKRVEEKSIDPRTTLVVYLRDHLHLKGTKIGCNEGGCGACTVMISDLDPADDTIRHYSVNACLMPLCAVFGKAVTTVEGIGGPLSVRKCLHPVQERLAKTHGSQCGYCTPGFVMAMYTLLRNSPYPSQTQIDECLQGNLCRCTGYRPILEAFYSFIPKEDGTAKVITNCGRGEFCCQNRPTNTINCGSEANNSCMQRNNIVLNHDRLSKRCRAEILEDSIEMTVINEDKKTTNNSSEQIKAERVEKKKLTTLDDFAPYDPNQELIFPPELKIHRWHRKSLVYEKNACLWLQPTSLDHLLELKRRYAHARLISGNSELAIELKFRFIPLPIAINLMQVPELREVRIDEDGVYLGMGLSLTEIKFKLSQIIETLPKWKTKIFRSVCEMLHYFAGKHVRNVASIAGNIATASPISDLNPIWMAAGARVVLKSVERGERLAPVDETLFVGYRRTTIAADEVLIGIWIPFSRSTQFFCAYKQTQRREDDIAIVTGAFSVTIDSSATTYSKKRKRTGENAPVIQELRIAYGGMAPTTKLASRKLCQIFVGRHWDAMFLEDLSAGIIKEFRLPPDVPGGMSHYRLTLALGFLLKFHAFVAMAESDGELEANAKYQLPQFHTTQIYQDVPRDQPAIDPVGRPLAHQSGEKHVTGEAIYGTDTKVFDCLHLAYVMSPVAHGTINSVDVTEALAVDGAIDYISAADVPGNNEILDVPIFAKNKILYHGQPIGAIIAVDHETARRAANLVKIDITPQTPIVSIEDAIRANSYFLQPSRVHSSRANNNNDGQQVEPPKLADDWEQKYTHFVKGQIRIGGQEHFYLETQNCTVVPDEDDEFEIISSTQCVNDVQRDVAAALAVQRHKIRVSVRRIGGGFGGKESCCGMFAAAAAVAASKLRKPIRLVLERFDDMAISGTRHPFLFDYMLAVDVTERRLLDFRVTTYSNCGYAIDLSKGVLERCLVHMDNVYRFGNTDFIGHLCKTHTSSNTAFRGFGAPQGMFAAETALKHAAEEFNLDIDELRTANFYTEGDITPFGMHLRQCNVERCWTECLQMANYTARRDGVSEFNAHNRYRKRGIYAIPTKFGIGFGFKQLNQAGALIHVFTDGSVLISHGGMEMGQGLHTKILQIAARCLKIDISLIHIHNTATDKVPNASPTAASVGSDMNGLAVQDACQKIIARLKPFRDANPDTTWLECVTAAYVNRISLSATGFGIIHAETVDFLNGRGAELFGYCVYGAAVTEVEIDCLTGDHHILRTDIVMDIGDSLNPAVDIGQIEGAFVQGCGLFTIEELKVRPNGVRLTRGPSNYKIPSADDVPREFHVKLLKGSSNNRGIFSSKAVGEPPLFLGASALLAIREAVRAYRIAERGLRGYFRLDSPATAERIRMACADTLIEKAINENITTTMNEFTPWTVEL